MIYDVLPQVTKPTTKKKRPRLIAVVTEACTGCEACLAFCPVDCIDHELPGGETGAVIPPVRIRWQECIGCQLCARACEALAWNAIEMLPIEEFEREYGVTITDGLGGRWGAI
ncbi:MAG: ferredoxin family protein [Candidatus Methylomirabilales bacterium]